MYSATDYVLNSGSCNRIPVVRDRQVEMTPGHRKHPVVGQNPVMAVVAVVAAGHQVKLRDLPQCRPYHLYNYTVL